MDTAQWPQEIVVKPIEEIVRSGSTCASAKAGGGIERKTRPQKEQALNCPRCNSTNTKFCYYNNYSLTQPRYFCKTCRRYWTEGGSLRNIPVGGGSRKNKRSSSSSSSSKKLPDLVTPPIITATLPSHHQNPNKIHDGQDLNLAFPAGYRTLSELVQLPNPTSDNHHHHNNNNNNIVVNKNPVPNSSNNSSSSPPPPPTSTTTSQQQQQLSALELLTGISSRGLNSFIPMPVPDPNTVYTSGFPMQDQFKPTTLSFMSLDGLGVGVGNGNGSLQETAAGRLLFPFEDLKATTHHHHHHHHHIDHQNKDQADSAAGYWTGMLGGAGSW